MVLIRMVVKNAVIDTSSIVLTWEIFHFIQFPQYEKIHACMHFPGYNMGTVIVIFIFTDLLRHPSSSPSFHPAFHPQFTHSFIPLHFLKKVFSCHHHFHIWIGKIVSHFIATPLHVLFRVSRQIYFNLVLYKLVHSHG